MRKEKSIQNTVMILLAVAVVAMSIGFAAFSQTLTIGGGSDNTTTIKKAKWLIHYLPTTYAENSATGYVASTSHTAADTDVTFQTTLNKPGDKFEFTIDVKNDGTFNAKLSSITMTELTAAQQKYLTYTINYDNNNYTASTSNITGSTLNPSDTKTVKVTVAYIQPENEADLPTEDDVTVSLTASLNYDQVQ